MPQFIKHVGQVDATGKKCVVVFREIPGEAGSCLVVETESLPQLYHDDLISSVEGASAQEDMDFFKYATRATFHDGRGMLEAMHMSGWLRKFPTSEITMLPTREIKIKLSDLNAQLGQLNNDGRTTSGDISGNTTVEEPANAPGTLSDSQIANQMRSQAAFFRKEAERLFAEADTLDPQTTEPVVQQKKPVAQTTEPAKKGRGRPPKK
jgi:hypothetical protein